MPSHELTTKMSAFTLLFWVAAIAAPALLCLAAILQFPAGADNVPMHWNFQGEVNEYGSPWKMMPLGVVLSFANGLLALAYTFNDTLCNNGLVHGISRNGALVLYKVVAIILVVVTAGIQLLWLSLALGSVTPL